MLKTMDTLFAKSFGMHGTNLKNVFKIKFLMPHRSVLKIELTTRIRPTEKSVG